VPPAINTKKEERDASEPGKIMEKKKGRGEIFSTLKVSIWEKKN